MEIILREDVDELGLEGEVVKVARGYARNYLIPKGFAQEATPQNLKAFEQRRKKIEIKHLKAKEQAEKFREQVEAITLKFVQKAGEEGKLYGSVTGMDIAHALEQKGVVIDRRKIVLDKPIKTVGEHDITVKIYPTVNANVKVDVEAEPVAAE